MDPSAKPAHDQLASCLATLERTLSSLRHTRLGLQAYSAHLATQARLVKLEEHRLTAQIAALTQRSQPESAESADG